MSIFRHYEIEREFDRWHKQLPTCEYDVGLSYSDVLTVHFVLCDMFYGIGSGIGGIGPKSLDLLISAISRQHGLDFLSGCDSAAFFKGEEPINNLLARYYEPLERLAYR